MPSCVVKWCRNRSGHTNENGITFHRFPKNGNRKEQWKKAVQLERRENDWIPGKASRICSIHFKDEDFYLSKKGLTMVKKTTIPICTMVFSREKSLPLTELGTEQPKTNDGGNSNENRTTNIPSSSKTLNIQLTETTSPQKRRLLQEQLGPSRESFTAALFQDQADSSDTNASNPPEPGDPLRLEQCRFCGKFTKDCQVTSEKPYLLNNRITLMLNSLTIDLDFNSTLPKSICKDCNGKLQELYDFVLQVKAAQNILINVGEREEFEEKRQEIETLIIKTVSDSLTPEENDTKEGIDLLTTETHFETLTVFTHKRRNDDDMNKNTVKKHKINAKKQDAAKKETPKVSEEFESTESILDIKEEVIEKGVDIDSAQINIEVTDTGGDVKCELDLATSALLSDIASHQTFS